MFTFRSRLNTSAKVGPQQVASHWRSLLPHLSSARGLSFSLGYYVFSLKMPSHDCTVLCPNFDTSLTSSFWMFILQMMYYVHICTCLESRFTRLVVWIFWSLPSNYSIIRWTSHCWPCVCVPAWLQVERWGRGTTASTAIAHFRTARSPARSTGTGSTTSASVLSTTTLFPVEWPVHFFWSQINFTTGLMTVRKLAAWWSKSLIEFGLMRLMACSEDSS